MGASVCTCVGKNRGFQPGDGLCICIPGYEFVDSNLAVSSENDGMYMHIYGCTYVCMYVRKKIKYENTSEFVLLFTCFGEGNTKLSD
jgi:hypothetical protein